MMQKWEIISMNQFESYAILSKMKIENKKLQILFDIDKKRRFRRLEVI